MRPGGSPLMKELGMQVAQAGSMAGDAHTVGRAQAKYYADLVHDESRTDVEVLLEVMNLLGLTSTADKVFNHLKAVHAFHPRALRRNMAREYLVLTLRHWASGTLDDWMSHLRTGAR